jgi:hypothetical protein
MVTYRLRQRANVKNAARGGGAGRGGRGGSATWTRTRTTQFQGLMGCQLPYGGLSSHSVEVMLLAWTAIATTIPVVPTWR